MIKWPQVTGDAAAEKLADEVAFTVLKYIENNGPSAPDLLAQKMMDRLRQTGRYAGAHRLADRLHWMLP